MRSTRTISTANACTTVPPCQSFCQSCPSPGQLTEHLARLGFILTLTLKARRYPSTNKCQPIVQPAQYHYSDGEGTEVIYLAGPDTAEDKEALPRHASRWWIYPGRDHAFYERLMHTLASRYVLTWTPCK